ncbi:MAG TPA: addiction module protein, partial [Longimicrobium sp.]|nr:addiction module protein [Longimicrobium sp.]
MKPVTVADLLRLSVAERLQLVQDLWDSIAADTNGEPARLPLSDEQRAEIRRRSEAHRRDPGAAIPL